MVHWVWLKRWSLIHQRHGATEQSDWENQMVAQDELLTFNPWIVVVFVTLIIQSRHSIKHVLYHSTHAAQLQMLGMATILCQFVKKTVICWHLLLSLDDIGTVLHRVAPQGYLASGDGYTHRYDRIITYQEKPNVWMILLYGTSLEKHWWRMIEYLELTGHEGDNS